MNTHGNKCPYCDGEMHPRNRCPASGQQCNKCKKIGHFSKVCKYSSHNSRKDVHSVYTDHTDASLDQLFVGSIEINSIQSQNNQPTTEIKKNILVVTKPYHRRYTSINFKVDSGSQANILPKSVYQELFTSDHKLEAPDCKMVAYGGTELNNEGSCTLYMRKDRNTTATKFYVSDVQGPAILGCESSLNMGYIKVAHSIQPEYIPLTKEKS